MKQWTALLLLAACAAPPAKSVCDGVECGAGRCVVDGALPLCLCNAGFVTDGLTCVASKPPADKCSPNPCTAQNRVCSTSAAGARCICKPGTYESAGECLLVSVCAPTPCTLPNQNVCAEVEGRAVCSCNAGHAPVDGGCDPEAAFDCNAKHVEGDAFEPDECPSLATDAGIGDPPRFDHGLSPSGDVDWWAIAGVAGHIYEVRATGSGSLALSIDTYANDGATPLGFDHRGQVDAVARFKASVAGNHYVRIRAFRANDSGAYTLSIADLGLDDFDDVPARATAAMVGGTFAGEVQFQQDVDVVKIPLLGGRKYEFAAADAGAALTLDLIAPNGTTRLRRTAAQPLNLVNRIRTTGDHFLAISGGASLAMGDFSIALVDRGMDDHGDVAADATPIVADGIGVLAEHEIPADVDMFVFNAVAGHTYRLSCQLFMPQPCPITLFDAVGTAVAVSFSNALEYEAPISGPLWAQYTIPATLGAPLTYQWRLEDFGTDDFGDTPATATAVMLGTATNGSLERSADIDAFSFTAVAGHSYRITATFTETNHSAQVKVLNVAGTTLATNLSPLVWDPGLSGTVYFAVSTGNGGYALTVTDLGLDDFGDTPATATSITPGPGSVMGTLENPFDVDAFRFSATAGRIYRFTCTPIAQGLVDLVLRNPAGLYLTTVSSQSSPTIVLAFEAPVSGDFTVEVLFRNPNGLQGTPYQVRLEDLGQDDHGDTAANATVITPGVPRTAVLETHDDVDVFALSTVAGHVYRTTCTNTYGCQAVWRCPVGTVTQTPGQAIIVKVFASEICTVEIGPSFPNTAQYTVEITDVGPDDHGDDLATATPVTVPTGTTYGTFEWLGDVDVFSFGVTASHVYRVSTTTAASQLRLRTAAGVTRASGGSPLIFQPTQAETLYLELWGTLGTYAYEIADLGLDAAGDDPTSALVIAGVGTIVNSAIEHANDVDFFAIDLAASTPYTVVTGGDYVQIVVFSPTGTALNLERSTPVSFVTAATGAGTHHIRIRHPYPPTPSPYSVQVTSP